ncbi:FAD-dependent oxidoreductase [Tychonema sp. LEGE 07199]|uniref:NAD(P)/FAD-dependent oxidoreductase n=1 Tax=unclassified Tychonema TaxID=2642144 RepID=UPI001880D9C8|nr:MULTISPECIES: FAD-dependent oxidoreductase [unclassified Tychonema]MBE9120810.1 FAD-dependent oxidoreductase [Tychonema sp. LEGE 07199]MBE9133124.1 FAD-dependent oxidoreductase [Tychonema sp. LEGE 07196]
MFDVVAIGAGMAGLICARQLCLAGYSVAVVEKSRGPGGRVATRRVQGTRADHGARYLEPQGEAVQALIDVLVDRQILKLWTDSATEFRQGEMFSIPSDCYVAPAGMNAVGKYIAEGLHIWYGRRVKAIARTHRQMWRLSLEVTDDNLETPQELFAKAVVVAIPAPQALMFLDSEIGLSPDFIDKLRSVEYDPCIAVMAGYPAARNLELSDLNPQWKSVSFPDNSDLAWVGLDSSKRINPQQPVFVVHSSANFAERYLEASDLNTVGGELLDRTSEYLMPWLNQPEWLQVHRWRYAFCRNPLPVSCLPAAGTLPLVCAGDLCGEGQIDAALRSGFAAANWVNSQLQNLPLDASFQ